MKLGMSSDLSSLITAIKFVLPTRTKMRRTFW